MGGKVVAAAVLGSFPLLASMLYITSLAPPPMIVTAMNDNFCAFSRKLRYDQYSTVILNSSKWCWWFWFCLQWRFDMNHSRTDFHYIFESCGYITAVLTCDIYFLFGVWPEKNYLRQNPAGLAWLQVCGPPKPLPSSAPEPLLGEGNGRLGQAKPNDNETYQSLT